MERAVVYLHHDGNYTTLFDSVLVLHSSLTLYSVILFNSFISKILHINIFTPTRQRANLCGNLVHDFNVCEHLHISNVSDDIFI